MGISNTIPPSRLIQPGVVANTAARPTSPFTGQAIYQVDTNQYLIWNGTAWVIPNQNTQNPTALELVTTATCSSGGTASGGIITVGSAQSSVTVSTAFSSTYDNYRIIWTGGTQSNASDVIMKLGTTATQYYNWMAYGAYNAGNATPAGAGQSNVTQGWSWVGGGDSNASIMDVDIYNPNQTKYTFFRALGFYSASANAGYNAGVLKDSTSYTAFTVTPAAGTITGGQICIYGYRKS